MLGEEKGFGWYLSKRNFDYWCANAGRQRNETASYVADIYLFFFHLPFPQ